MKTTKLERYLRHIELTRRKKRTAKGQEEPKRHTFRNRNASPPSEGKELGVVALAASLIGAFKKEKKPRVGAARV